MMTHDAAGPYLGDTLAMGQAFLALYNVTGDRNDLNPPPDPPRSFIAANFAPASPGTGFLTSRTPPTPPIARIPIATKTSPWSASHHYCHSRPATPLITRCRRSDALPRRQHHRPAAALRRQPCSPTKTSRRTPSTSPSSARRPTSKAVALHTAALRSLTSHELIEWRDPADPNPLPTAVTYPPLKRPPLFLCTARACSSPIYRPEDVAAKIHKAQLSN